MNDKPLPGFLGSESCIQLPLTSCADQEWVTNASLVLVPGGGATFTDVHLTEIIVNGATDSVVTTAVWSGTYTVASSVITLSLTRNGGTVVFTGAVQTGQVALEVPQPRGTFSYLSRRQ